MKSAYILNNIEAYFLIVERAQSHGKKVGESMQEEFQEVLKEHPEWFEFLGAGEVDVDLLAGNLRESGLKVLNLNEVARKVENKND